MILILNFILYASTLIFGFYDLMNNDRIEKQNSIFTKLVEEFTFQYVTEFQFL